MRRETYFSQSAILPRLQIEITRDTQSSIAHAAPSDVSLPAVSSIGGLRTPAPVRAAPPSWGRHPQTFTNSEVAALPRHFCFAPMNGHRETQRPSPFCASIVTECQRKLHERPYCAVPSTAFTFTMKLLWIRI